MNTNIFLSSPPASLCKFIAMKDGIQKTTLKKDEQLNFYQDLFLGFNIVKERVVKVEVITRRKE